MATAKKKREATVEIKRIAIDRLKPHPRNPRIHPEPGTPEWDALRASILNTYFDPVVWNKRNGLLVSGHLRLKILRSEGYTHVDASVVDFDEPTHLACMLAANKQQGRDDGVSVLTIIKDVELTHLDVGLTGFTAGEIGELHASLHDVSDEENESKGDENITAKWAVLVEVDDEREQEALLTRFMQEGLKCRGLML